MKIDLTGGHAVITGGSQGLGEGAAHALGEAGARISLVARSADRLEAARAALAAKNIQASAHPADITREDDVARIGAVIGHAMGGRDGAVVGSIIGAGTGAAVPTDRDGRVVGYEYDDAPAPVVYAQPRVVYVPARRVVYEEPPVVVRPRGYVVAYRNYGHGYYYGHEGRWDGDRGWHHGGDRHRHGDDD